MLIKTSLIGLLFLVQTCLAAQTLDARFEIRYSNEVITGLFSESTVDYHFDSQNLAESYFKAIIQVASLNTEMKDRDSELLKKKYFDVKNYPQMAFTTTRVFREGVSYFMEGDLTIKDVTTKMKLPIEVSFNQNGLSLLKTSFTIDRRDYNVGKSHFLLQDDVIIRVLLKP